jgi:hypothetical protein
VSAGKDLLRVIKQQGADGAGSTFFQERSIELIAEVRPQTNIWHSFKAIST